MKIVEITKNDEAKYAKFVANHPLGSVHQTLAWGEFQAKLGGRDKYWCFAVEDSKNQIVASALILRQTLPFKKSWLYSPRGPLADFEHPDGRAALNELLQKIQELAKQNNAVFFRFDPPLLQSQNIDWKSLHAHHAHAHYQPENTLILDLNQSSEDLLKQMKPKGRYNIKVAQKHEVKIRVSNVKHDIAAFYNLLQQTTSRDQFSGHNQKFYEDMLAILGSQVAKLYLAEYQNKVVAGLITTQFKDTTIYYFGASSNENRNVMAPYLLQWQAIQDAKAAGSKYYDFLGIAPENTDTSAHDPTHPWAGVTDFKLKFGGARVDYQPAQEITYQPLWYAIIKLIKKIRG